MKLKQDTMAPALISGFVLFLVFYVEFIVHQFPEFDSVQRLEWMTYDWRVKLAYEHREDISQDFGLVLIDDDDLQKFNDGTYKVAGLTKEIYRWPWDRSIFAVVLDRLAKQGATAVAFDILFDQLDDGKIQISSDQEISSDEYFAAVMRRNGNILLAGTRGPMPADLFQEHALKVCSIESEGDYGISRRFKPFFNRRVWHPYLISMKKVLGLDLNREPVFKDGVITIAVEGGEPFEMDLDAQGRINPLDFDPESQFQAGKPFENKVWHLGIILASMKLGLDLENAQIEKSRIVLKGDNGITRTIPLDKEGFFYPEWSVKLDSSDARFRRMKGAVNNVGGFLFTKSQSEDGVIQAPYRNKLVVIGSIATGNNVSDLGATPLEKRANLVGTHLNIANTLIRGNFVHQLPVLYRIFIILFFGIMSAGMTWKFPAIWSGVGVVSFTALYIAAAVTLFNTHGIWLPIVLPTVGAFLLMYVSLASYRMAVEQFERRRVKSIFSKIISPSVVNELLKGDNRFLNGIRREITVIFADIRGFTEMTDHFEVHADQVMEDFELNAEDAAKYQESQAAKVLDTVNTYLAGISDQVIEFEGTMDKYIGDCVMAFWGAPLDNPNHAIDAVRASIEGQRAIFRVNEARREQNTARERINQDRELEGKRPLPMLSLMEIGIGVNSGPATVGLMGSENGMRNYTVFGREVNLAARLESISGKSRILIGERTYQLLKQQDLTLAESCIPLEPVQVKGIRGSIQTFEVPWRTEDPTNDS
ncbi:MAG TPA: adenylate/guanylate cyclase domain-containing protein [Verrucomicrobia bacterium]|nr:adenylate/guanylate cyclase domain-containing protein [Verrucomicrobiota bacterium]